MGSFYFSIQDGLLPMSSSNVLPINNDETKIPEDAVQAISKEITYAKHDPYHCLTPGLFKSYKRGERTQRNFHCKMVIDESTETSIEFKGYQPLGADDLRVLQGLIAMSGPNGLVLEPEPEDEQMHQLRLLLNTRHDAMFEDARVAKGSLNQLCDLIGYVRGGSANKRILECIERLRMVVVFFETNRNGRQERKTFNVLSHTYTSVTKGASDGTIMVALNPLIAKSVVGNARYVKINLQEVRNLKNDAAVLIHQRLCGWIDSGQSSSIGMEKLFEYVWDTENVITKDGEKYRKKTIRAAMNELAKIGWKIREVRSNKKIKFEIERSRI